MAYGIIIRLNDGAEEACEECMDLAFATLIVAGAYRHLNGMCLLLFKIKSFFFGNNCRPFQ